MPKKVRVTPAEFRAKHARRTTAAIEDMRAGVERVDEAPGAKAAAKQDKMRTKLLAKIDDGTWAKRTAEVPLEEWKRAMLDKGVGRVAAGVESAADKIESFAEDLIAYENRLLPEIDKMADVSLEDSIARASAWIRGMSKFKR